MNDFLWIIVRAFGGAFGLFAGLMIPGSMVILAERTVGKAVMRGVEPIDLYKDPKGFWKRIGVQVLLMFLLSFFLVVVLGWSYVIGK